MISRKRSYLPQPKPKKQEQEPTSEQQESTITSGYSSGLQKANQNNNPKQNLNQNPIKTSAIYQQAPYIKSKNTKYAKFQQKINEIEALAAEEREVEEDGVRFRPARGSKARTCLSITSHEVASVHYEERRGKNDKSDKIEQKDEKNKNKKVFVNEKIDKNVKNEEKTGKSNEFKESSCNEGKNEESLLISTNINRLKTAYFYLTPIIDEIIKHATNYSSKDFKELIKMKKPICSITYNQYIQAYQASKIITQVTNDLSQQQEEMQENSVKSTKTQQKSLKNNQNPYRIDYSINNATIKTIKKEDLLENIERMADRIFIDRDLMKQLVNLHELITDTIKKLKFSLEQVSNEGLTQEAAKQRTPSSQNDENHDEPPQEETLVDSEAIRKHIAEHFIVIGEPKAGCDCRHSKQNSKSSEISENIDRMNKIDATMSAKQKSIVMGAHIDQTNPLSQSKEKNRNRWFKRKENKKTRSVDTSDAPRRGDSILVSLAKFEHGQRIGRRNNSKMSLDEIQELLSKGKAYTLGVQGYEGHNLNCNDPGVAKACAVLPKDAPRVHADSPTPNNNQTNQTTQNENESNPFYDLDEEVMIVADSESNDLNFESEISNPRISSPRIDSYEGGEVEDEEEMEEETGGGTKGEDDERVPRLSVSAGLYMNVNDCVQKCDKDGAPCADLLSFLRSMMAKVADQLMYLKEQELIDFEEKEFADCEVAGLDTEYYVMQEVMFCLEELEFVKNRLMEMNWMEAVSEMPDEKLGCCYREYPHVHSKVQGIPIVVKISQTLLDILQLGFPFAPARMAEKLQHRPSIQHTDTDMLVKPSTRNKSCACRKPTLKSLLREKCALAKMIHSRNEVAGRNKVAMISINPFENTFGMSANSLLTQSTHFPRKKSSEFAESATESTEPIFQGHQADLFQVMDMADSNTSLPYVVNRTSLPNVTVCGAMDITVQELRRQVRNIQVTHPIRRIERELQEIGLDNLLKASLPAKCCRPNALNRTDDENEPFHASLNSLPLTTSDLQLIIDVAEEENYNATLCNYYHDAFDFCFERYTHFQEWWAEKRWFKVIAPTCKVIVPTCRVYLVYYFEVFKKDEVEHQQQSVTSTFCNRKRQKQQNRHSAHARKIRFTQTPRNTITDFFKKIIFAAANDDSSNTDCSAKQRKNTSHSKMKEKIDDKIVNERIVRVDNIEKHEKADRNVKIQKNEKISTKTMTKVSRRLKNQRLQTNFDECRGRFRQDAVTVMWEDLQGHGQGQSEENKQKENKNKQKLSAHKIPSALKNFTVSTGTGMNTNAFRCKIVTKDEGPLKNEARARSKVNLTLKHEDRSRSRVNLTLKQSKSRCKRGNCGQFTPNLEKTRSSNCTLSDGDESSKDLGLEQDLTRSKTQKPDETPEKSTQSQNNLNQGLGTIYESEEKLLSIDQLGHLDSFTPNESFFDYLKASELSKSFQRFIESKEGIDIFEKNQIEPEDFWRRYFQLRRDSHHRAKIPIKCNSALSLGGETEATHVEESSLSVFDCELSQKSKLIPSKSSKIPLPIRKTSLKSPEKISDQVLGISSEILKKSDEINGNLCENFDKNLANLENLKKLQKIEKIKSNLSILSQMNCLNQNPKLFYSEMSNETEHSVKSEKSPGKAAKIERSATFDKSENSEKSSLQILANKNGPGYVTILHPACGCPEVSIFIPCYCSGENGDCGRTGSKNPLKPGLTSKHGARMAANTNGRHILLPATCRIPRLKSTLKDSKDSNNSNNLRNSQMSKNSKIPTNLGSFKDSTITKGRNNWEYSRIPHRITSKLFKV